MINLKINNSNVKIEPGKTVLDAAEKLKISIPTMCFLKGYDHFSSCMVCIVKDKKSNRFLPACSAPVEEGMDIETDTDEIKNIRKTGLELLLSDHIGDCEAPCRNVCPAKLDIPVMIRLMQKEKYQEASQLVEDELVLPGILSYICPAPCENGCRRKQYDDAVSIRRLVQYVAGTSSDSNYKFPIEKSSGKRVAIIGGGPAGLAAAFSLACKGHQIVLFDQNELPGGALQYKVSRDILPQQIIDNDLKVFHQLDVKFEMKKKIIDEHAPHAWDSIKKEFDAVLIAIGAVDERNKNNLFSDIGKNINLQTLETKQAGIFAAGDLVRKTNKAVHSIAQGELAAHSIDLFLKNEQVLPPHKRFNSLIGKILEGEMEEFLKEAHPHKQQKSDKVFNKEQVKKEIFRCLHCDCRKKEACQLRDYSDECNAKQSHFNSKNRKQFIKHIWKELLVYEFGKCIKCGICVRISVKAGIKFGYTFLNRGFNTVVDVPFGEELSNDFNNVVKDCIAHCPTGALSDKNS